MSSSFLPAALRIALAAIGLLVPRYAEASSRPTFVHWMTPAAGEEHAPMSNAVVAASSDGGTDDGGDAGSNNGYVPYQGGPIIAQLRVAAALWGANVDPNVVTNLGSFYSALTSGSFMHFVSEYSTPTQTAGAYGTFGGLFSLQVNNHNAQLTDSDIQTELSQQIAGGALPPADPNTLFMVYLPPGVSVNDPSVGQSCVPSGFCAYHKSGNGIIYGVIPDFSQGGCAPGPPGCTSCCGDKSVFENVTAVSSHEVMEAVTDPLPLENPAWVNVFFGEIGDLCAVPKQGDAAYTQIFARDETAFTAQRGWSNAAYVAHHGTPTGTGCVDYPTTLCCNDARASCSWLANGSTTCPNPTGNSADASTTPNGIVVTAPTLGGFGSGTMTVARQSISRFFLPEGVTDWLTPSSSGTQDVLSPTFNLSTDVTPLGTPSACFAFVTNAMQRGIVQCVPDTPPVVCSGSLRRVEETSSGPMCCITLDAKASADGQQLCAPLAELGNTLTDLPAMGGRNLALFATTLLGFGTAASARRRRPRGSENKS